MSIEVPTSVLPGEHLHALRARLRGDLLLPGDDGWDDARRAWQLTVDQHPTAIAIAADVDDVVTVVTAARRFGLRVAPQSTGHAAGALTSLDDTILLRTSRLRDVDIDPVVGTARVGSGAVWGDVAAAAAMHDLAAVAGMAASVGVVGFILGGGLGWLARSHGRGIDSVLAVEAVDARGRVVRIDRRRNADLFEGLRAGIAPVIVTAVTLQLHPLAEIWAGGLMWPLDRAADVVHAWHAWIETVPDTVTSLLRVLRFPPLPELPEAVRGGQFVAVEVAVHADAGDVAAVLAPLRALAPAIDSMRPMPPAELATVHGDPPQPSPAYGESVLLVELSDAAVAGFVDAALAPASDALLSVELRHLGGALAPHVPGDGLAFAVGIVPVPEAAAGVAAAAQEFVCALAPHASPRAMKNFTERPGDPEAIYGADLARLRTIVAAWDPEQVIVAGHPVLD
ncbi:FAD-binding protein [Microbacterium sp.]|uniref:FAD-binding oxidoreductase n=1 Tax=Microbacterium sp. TaxID=51671 RepID=UPI0028970C23|nr:FAD-binding protein [Microbacterium sp.]